jgi:hypothetical protein
MERTLRNILTLIFGVLCFVAIPTIAMAVSIWGATDRAPAVGTYRLPVDTSSSSSPGYIEVQDIVDLINVTGFAAYSSGGTNSFGIDPTMSSTIDPLADNSFAIGVNLTVGDIRGDEITSIGYDDGTQSCNGNHGVCIGFNVEMNCTNGVAIGDSNRLDCFGASPEEKSVVIGNDNVLDTAPVGHATFVGHTLESSTGCDNCGAFGTNIDNSMDGSIGLGNSNVSSTEIVGTTNTVWIGNGLYTRLGGDTETNVTTLTCNSTSDGLVQYNTSENALTVCNGSAWQSIPMVPSSGANNTAISQYSMAYLDETSEANLKAALNLEAGTDYPSMTAHGDKVDKAMTIRTETASYTLVLTDAAKYVRMNVGSANDLTVPLNSSVAFPTGTQILIRQVGAGQTTVVATGGVTITSPETLKLRAQHSTASLIKVGTDAWELAGDLEEVP